jgi:hypothetical protein
MGNNFETYLNNESRENYIKFLEKCSKCIGGQIGGEKCMYTKSNPLEKITSILDGNVDCPDKIVEGERINVYKENSKKIFRDNSQSSFYVTINSPGRAELFVDEMLLKKMVPTPENDSFLEPPFNLVFVDLESLHEKKHYEFVNPAVFYWDGEKGEMEKMGKIIVHKAMKKTNL